MPEVVVKERFDPLDKWLPGEKKRKEVWFENPGDLDMLLRFHLQVKWVDHDGKVIHQNDLPGPIEFTWYQDQVGNDKVPDGWTKIGDYYYYNQILRAGTPTDITLQSVKFSEDLSNDTHEDNYTGAKCTVTVAAETILVNKDAASKEWNVNANIFKGGIGTDSGKVDWAEQ